MIEAIPIPKEKFNVPPDVKVYCAFDDYVPLDELVRRKHPQNPNTHPREQIALLAEMILDPNRGWRETIKISTLSGLIIKGHGRLDSALLNAFRGAPVEYQDYASEEEELADLLADNAIAALSRRDPVKVKPLVIALQQKGMKTSLTGLRPIDLKKLFKEEKKTTEAVYQITADMNECYDYVMVFVTNEMDEAFLYNLLGIEREQSHKKTGLGLGRTITFQKFMKQLVTNRTMIDKAATSADITVPTEPAK